MELEFEKRGCRYLQQVIREIGTEEQTQEIRLGDGLPDAGRVIGAWGQVVLRGKEWRGDCVILTGGVLAWVLYAPEDGSQSRCVDGWLPFKMKWELPEGAAEGTVNVNCQLSGVDGRILGPRKILVRANVSVRMEALSPAETAVFAPGENGRMLELLNRTYPMELIKESGEKSFSVESEGALAAALSGPVRLVGCCLKPSVTEKRVLSDKITFRGNGNLHLICMDGAGDLHIRDEELVFSQFIQLDGAYGPDARADLTVGVTAMEPEWEDDGSFRIKCGLVAQYCVSDREIIELTEDAYALDRNVTLQTQMLTLPAILENRTETVSGEQVLPVTADEILDCQFLPEQPRQRWREDRLVLEIPGTVQLLYLADGKPAVATARWEGTLERDMGPDVRMEVLLRQPVTCQAEIRDGSVAVQMEIPMELTAVSGQTMQQLTGVTLGDVRTPDPARPSLILRRAGGEELWGIAKGCGSTVEEIRLANGLTQEPEAGKMLLIPVH